MWPFGKSKKKKAAEAEAALPDLDTLCSTDAQRMLLEQMRGLRAEIGEDTLQKMAAKLQMENLKKQVREDIDGDEKKRDRLLDELRYNMQEDK